MNPLAKLAWHFGGLAAASYGAWSIYGGGGVALVVGVWAMAATVFDAIVERL